ncbi:hypothetical protein BDN70DRAFT_896328 [Pholiota conissans]|uniref:Uncharacterized protein n=1 Tax=Pholiota conissans TaxID=109636 RepID=A0A9P5Z048_9AGAR|nr:hypothetical protein BDN70DRAFT_896328 [Pholiota conissans]
MTDALHEVYGAALLGIIVNAWLVGIICMMSYQYYNNFPGDGRIIKSLIIADIQCIHISFDVTYMIYHYLVSSFGNGENLAVGVWLSQLAACRYTMRGASLSEMKFTYFVRSNQKLRNLSSDCFILVEFSRFASDTRQRTGISGIFAIIELTTLIALGFNFSHIFLSQPLGAVYTVSFLANLDARRVLRTIGSETVPADLKPITDIDPIQFKSGKVPTGNLTTISFGISERSVNMDDHTMEIKAGGNANNMVLH